MVFQEIYNIIDVYGFSPKLFIGSYSKYGTIVGVIATIITYLFLIIIFFYYMFQLFSKRSLITISSTRAANSKDFIKINKNNFFFAFALEDNNYSLYIDEEIYYPEIYYKRGVRNSDGQFDYSDAIKFELDRCNTSYFGDNFENIIKNYSLNNMYCIKNLNHEIKGAFSDEEYSFITLKLYTCKNNTEKRNCKNESEINKYLDGAIFTIQYQDYIFNPNNYSYPFKPIVGDFLTTVSQKYFKELYIYLKEYSLTSDKGLIFEDKKKNTLYLFDYSKDLMSFQTRDFFFQLTFRMSPHVSEVSRSYTKAQTLVSYIGGFITFIESMFVNLNGFFNKFIIYEKIINKLFFYKPDNKTKNKINIINKKKFLNNSNIHYHLNNKGDIKLYKKSLFLNDNSASKNKNIISSENLLIDNHKSIESDLNKINNTNKYLKNKFYSNYHDKFSHRPSNKTNILNNVSSPFITLNFCDNFSQKYELKISYFKKVFYKCISKKNRKNYYYKKGIEIIKQKLDIISIIHDSFCLELIKLFYFDSQQKILLDFCFKNDLINYKFNNSNFEITSNVQTNEEVIKSINNIFNQNINNNNNDKNNEINQYLLNLYI